MFLPCAQTAVTLISLFPPHSVNVDVTSFMTNKLKSAVFCSRPTSQHNTPQKHDNHQAGTKEPGEFFYKNCSSKASTGFQKSANQNKTYLWIIQSCSLKRNPDLDETLGWMMGRNRLILDFSSSSWTQRKRRWALRALRFSYRHVCGQRYLSGQLLWRFHEKKFSF